MFFPLPVNLWNSFRQNSVTRCLAMLSTESGERAQN